MHPIFTNVKTLNFSSTLRLYFSLVSLVLMSITSSAQEIEPDNRRCGTSIPEEKVSILRNVGFTSLPPEVPGEGKPTAAYEVKIQVHIVCSTTSPTSTYASPSDINSALAYLNSSFAQTGIYFTECRSRDFILNSSYHYMNIGNAAQEMALGSHDALHAINIYIVDKISNGGYGGYTYFLNNTDHIFLAAKGSSIADGHALTHEMGHFFGLQHTNGDFNPSGYTDELVNGSNSSSAGDAIGDTPADPAVLNYILGTGTSCTYPSFPYSGSPCTPPSGYTKFCDPNGQQYTPLGNNLMFPLYCSSFNTFTNNQLQRILATYNTYYATKYDGRFDIVTRDNIEDAGIEATVNWGPIWASPYIWNCRSSSSCTSDENAGYSNPNTNNYLHVKVENNGCSTAPSFEVHAYWTLGSTGEKWPAAWNGATICSKPAGDEFLFNGSPGQTVAAGLAAGATAEVIFPWKPIDPTTYTCGPPLSNWDDGHPEICYLSRVVCATDGMNSETSGAISHNVIFNNNIATRNSSLLPLPGNKSGRLNGVGTSILVQSILSNSAAHDLHIRNYAGTTANFLQNGVVTVKLSPELWSAWYNSGHSGEGISIYNGNEHRISINSDNAVLRNVNLAPDSIYALTMLCWLSNVTNDASEHEFTIYQTLADSTDLLGSACLFKVAIIDSNVEYGQQRSAQTSGSGPNKAGSSAQSSNPNIEMPFVAANNQEFSFYPIPTEDKGTLTFTNGQDDIVTVDLLDINGRRVAVLIDNQAFVAGQHKVSTSFNEIPSGIYYVKFTSLYEVKTLKVVVKRN